MHFVYTGIERPFKFSDKNNAIRLTAVFLIELALKKVTKNYILVAKCYYFVTILFLLFSNIRKYNKYVNS